MTHYNNSDNNNSPSLDHPLHQDNPSRYPTSPAQQQPSYDDFYSSYSNSNPSSTGNNNQQQGYHQPTPQQLEQLQLQKQHQLRIEEQMAAADSIRSDQHRVARPTAAGAFQDPRTPAESKPANFYAYPPQPIDLTTEDQEPAPFKSRLTRLVRFPCSSNGKALMLVIALEALLVIVVQTVVVVKYFKALRDTPVIDFDIPQNTSPPYLDTDNSSRAIPAYLIVFVFAQLFQFVLAWDAVSVPTPPPPLSDRLLCCHLDSVYHHQLLWSQYSSKSA